MASSRGGSGRGVTEHVFGKHGVGIDDHARMIRVADASVKEGNQVFRDIVVLGLVAVVPVLLGGGLVPLADPTVAWREVHGFEPTAIKSNNCFKSANFIKKSKL